MKDLISVIIPVYNGEKYIARCIDSLLSQDYDNLEVIIVNDGSNDRTADIINKYNDNRIILVNSSNKGVASARNTGLYNASGKFVIFADSDDWYNKNTISKMMEIQMSINSDLVIFEYSRNLTVDIEYCKSYKVVELSQEEALNKVISPDGFYGSVWGKLFRLDLIKQINLHFNNELHVGEDLLFVVEYILESKKVYYSNLKVYNYFANSESILHTLTDETFYKRLDILKTYEYILSLNINNTEIINKIISIYTRELCDWHYQAEKLGKIDIAKEISHKIRPYLSVFLKNKTFSLKTKLAALLKYKTPQVVTYFKRSDRYRL